MCALYRFSSNVATTSMFCERRAPSPINLLQQKKNMKPKKKKQQKKTKKKGEFASSAHAARRWRIAQNKEFRRRKTKGFTPPERKRDLETTSTIHRLTSRQTQRKHCRIVRQKLRLFIGATINKRTRSKRTVVVSLPTSGGDHLEDVAEILARVSLRANHAVELLRQASEWRGCLRSSGSRLSQAQVFEHESRAESAAVAVRRRNVLHHVRHRAIHVADPRFSGARVQDQIEYLRV